MQQRQWKLKSVVGDLFLVASSNGLQGVFLEKQEFPLVDSLKSSEPSIKHLASAVRQLEEYFSGKRKSFDLKFDVQGTAFQKKVWAELSRIPYAQTQSYKDIARRIRNPKAVRAVGSANGKNPLCIIVPCHRVIAANGGLGGYAGGLKMKSQLLDLERALAS